MASIMRCPNDKTCPSRLNSELSSAVERVGSRVIDVKSTQVNT